MADGYNAPGGAKPFGIFSGAAWQPEGKALHIYDQVSEYELGTIVGPGDIKVQTRQVVDLVEPEFLIEVEAVAVIPSIG